ncbi:MAG: M28 family peptidase [Saprospiraceae bacterium]|nr:M28 family peptidase [Saprospiraceae bacterium]
MKKFSLVFILGILILAIACKNESSQNTSTTDTPAQAVAVPSFDRDSAYAFVAKQVEFGPRVPGSDAHKACKDWLVGKFKSYGAEVIEQNFQAKTYYGATLPATNIIAQFNPQIGKRILLAAHWDSRHAADSPLSTERKGEPILGADDGGSGTAVLLEVARQLQQHPIEMGVDIILFDAEDLGESGTEDPNSNTTWCLGSQYWARNIHTGNYRPQYGILLDMVGSKGAQFPVEQYSQQFAPQVVREVWLLAQNMGYNNYFLQTNGGGVTDDHYFVNTIARIPMIDIINRSGETETGFGAHWHTHNDNLDVIDKRTLKAVGQVVTAVIYREHNGTL